MDPRSAGGVGRNTASQRAADSAAADRNSRGAVQGPASRQVASIPTQTPYGAPVHTVPNGTYGGISVAQSPSSWKNLTDQVNTYNDAATKWNQSAQQRSLGNLLNNFAPFGLSMEPPQFDRPKTYVGGDYHTGLNIGNLAGGLLGGLMGPGGGIPGSAIGGKLYSALGFQDAMLGGGPVPNGWNYGGALGNSANQNAGSMPGMPGAPGAPNAGQMAQGGPGNGQGSAASHLQQLAQLNAQVPGNPAAPSNSGTASAAQTPAGPNFAQMMARMQPVTPGYGVNLPGYRYSGRTGTATV